MAASIKKSFPFYISTIALVKNSGEIVYQNNNKSSPSVKKVFDIPAFDFFCKFQHFFLRDLSTHFMLETYFYLHTSVLQIK